VGNGHTPQLDANRGKWSYPTVNDRTSKRYGNFPL